MHTSRTLMAAAAMVGLGLVGTPAAASAGAVPVALDLPQATAFAVLGHSCGGIQETSATTGFDPSTGYPTGEVGLSTRCGGSGRGGGYHVTTYTSSADVTWDFTGAVVAYSVPASGSAVPGFAATDAAGNQVYDSGTGAFLLLVAGFVPAPRLTGISAAAGPSSGGTPVTITGTGFTGATAVSFGATPAASFTVVSDTSITAVSPAAPPAAVDVTVTGPGGTSAVVPAAAYAYTVSTVCGTGCAFLSPSAVSAATGAYFTFTVVTTGGVVPTLTARGRLPAGVAFVDNLDGTGTLSGVPVANGTKPAAGVYHLKVKAVFTSGPHRHVVTQKLVLTVG